MPFKITRTQWPVGQGCLATGSINCDSQNFEYMYDCGSLNVDALKTSIESLAPTGNLIDSLFISHLDSDHVNGIEYLLGNKKVVIETVYLPYLNNKEIVFIVSHAMSQGSLSANMLNLLASPAHWFGARGVKNIVYVSGQEGESGLPGGTKEPVDPSNYKEGFPILKSEHNKERLEQWASKKPKNISKGEAKVASEILLPPGTDIWLKSPANIVWLLIPYVPYISDKTFSAFLSEIKGLGISLDEEKRDVSTLLPIIQDESKRNKLKEAYGLIARDHNCVSLCLYSGPGVHKSGAMDCHIGSYRYWHHVISNSADYRKSKYGWLGTGDAKLKSTTSIYNLINRYQQHTNNIAILMVPHHGSVHNYSPQLLDFITPHIVFATAGEGNRHPHREVMNSVVARGYLFHTVTQNGASVLLENIYIDI